MNFFKKLFSSKRDIETTSNPDNSQVQSKYELFGVDLKNPLLNALTKRYESENGRPATDEERTELQRMALELLQETTTSDSSGKEDVLFQEENLDYRYHAHLVLSFICSYHYNFCNLNSFYDYDNAVKEHKEIIDRLNGEEITSLGIKLAIRFCHIQYAKGICNQRLTVEEEKKLINREWEYPDAEKSFTPIIPIFKKYWDDVLLSYKRPSAKTNRLNYLVELLDNVSAKSSVRENVNLRNEILLLRQYYAQQLE